MNPNESDIPRILAAIRTPPKCKAGWLRHKAAIKELFKLCSMRLVIAYITGHVIVHGCDKALSEVQEEIGKMDLVSARENVEKIFLRISIRWYEIPLNISNERELIEFLLKIGSGPETGPLPR